MEYKGFEIVVHAADVVDGNDPMGAVTSGFVAEVCKRDPVQDDPDQRVMWDYPYGLSESLMQGATEEEVVTKAKAFIDAGGKPARAPRHSDTEDE
jgi:hypothetical protein